MPRKNSTDKPPVLSETQIVKAHSYTRKIKKFSFHKSEEIEIISKLTLVPYWNSKHELSTSYGKNHAQVLHIQLAPRKKYIDFLKSLHHRKIFKRQKKNFAIYATKNKHCSKQHRVLSSRYLSVPMRIFLY